MDSKKKEVKTNNKNNNNDERGKKWYSVSFTVSYIQRKIPGTKYFSKNK